MTTKPLNQNGDRYKKIDNGWEVSATSSIKPITLIKGQEPQLIPLLEADGVVVKLYDTYLVSKGTLALINSGENPHYDIVENGVVVVKGKGVSMGKTIPIININVDGLLASGSQRQRVDIYAGVKEVKFNYLTDRVEGVPKGLLDQINFTIGSTERPPDTFSIYDLSGSLTADYSIESLKTETTQTENGLDKAKLEKFVVGVADRLKILRNDFNSIKETFYNGKPPNTPNAFQYTKVATTDDSEETLQHKLATPVVIKNTSFVEMQTTPQQKTTEVAAKAAKGVEEVAKEVIDPTKPRIIQLRMKQQRKQNNIPVFTEDPSTKRLPKRGPLTIYEGNAFWGYLYKDNWRNNEKIWKIYEADKTTFIGYGIADNTDFVEEVK